MRIPAQLAPVAAPQVQVPHVRVSLLPVYQVVAVEPVTQAWGPSNMMQFAVVLAGTQTCPIVQPPPSIPVPQNRPGVAKAAVPGVATPCGAQDPVSVCWNTPACTP